MRSLTAAIKTELHAQETGEVFASLITIDHADLDEPVRLTDNGEDIVSNGHTYTARPIGVILPDEQDGRPPTARLVVSAVNRELIAILRTVRTAPTVKIAMVMASAPDTIEAEWPDFQLRNISYNALQISGEVTLSDFSRQAYPAVRFDPASFPGLFS